MKSSIKKLGFKKGLITILFCSCIILSYVSCGNKTHDNAKKPKLSKKPFKVKLVFEGIGDRFLHPDSTYYYYIGDEEPRFIPGDTPAIRIPEWKILLLNDTVLFQKPRTISVITKGKLTLLPEREILFEVKRTGPSCDDTDEHTITLEDKTHKIILKGLAEVRFFQNTMGTYNEAYLISYHHCLIPDLKIFKISK